MSNDRFLNELILEQQQLLEDTHLLLKNKFLFNKFLFISRKRSRYYSKTNN
jgi:hypothetical protein